MKKILFTGGGSAGHVVPNVALIEELLSRGVADACYMGTSGIEKGIISGWKIPYFELECPKLIRGGGWAGMRRNLKIPFLFRRAVQQAKEGLRLLQPDVVFSKGGYVALPVVVAASKLHIPCYAHESDFSAGLANRISARFCKKVFTSFPETAKRLSRGVHSGAPIKRSVFSHTRKEARKSLGLKETDKVLLVFGGGSGSVAINEAVRKHLKTLLENYVILHVCGQGKRIESNLKGYRQFEFVADMGALYACADVVVARAGAGTVFEILALKKPALFIPLEGQTRGDQLENAEYFRRKGLCRVLRQKQLDALPQAVDDTFEDGALKERLSVCGYGRGNERILQELLSATV